MKRAIFTTLSVVCAALPALSAELEFSGGGEAEYDDNVFRTRTHQKDDVLLRLRPGVRVYEDRGDDLNFSIGYEAPVEFSTNYGSKFIEVDHVGNGTFDYHVNPQLDLFGSDRYAYLRSTLRHPDVAADLTLGSLPLTDFRDRVKVNDGTLGTLYRFSPRTTGRVLASSSFFDSSRQDRARVWSLGGTADLEYRLTPKHQIGAGAGYSYQEFGDRLDIPGSQTDTYHVFGTWRWLISPTFTFDLNAGPAYLQTQQASARRLRAAPLVPFSVRSDGTVVVSTFSSCGTVDGLAVASLCPPDVLVTDPAAASFVRNTPVQLTNLNPAGRRDHDITAFIDAVLTQRWSPTLSSALRYARDQADASGLGGTVISDAVSLSNTWDFLERWQLAVRGDWVRRQSAFQIAETFDQVVAPPGGIIATRNGLSFNATRHVNVDTDTWAVAARITHQLFKTTSIYAQVRYSEQSSTSSSLGRASDFGDFLATFGVRHVFEPIPLW